GYSLRDLKSGDSGAWSWLVAEFSGKIVGYATRMGARDPEEVMSATLETVATRIADFEGNESQMRSFIFSIAHARIVDDLRKATRRSEVSIENTLTLLEADEPNEDTFSDPDLLDALSRLPEDQRRMLELRYVVGLSTKETADAIAKSEVATRVGLSRAFARLKELLVDDLRSSSEELLSW
ncbi:MAG: sigma-70 family RNA polymerase sigma factor, partial [Actinomycetota bacterium]|nr:sigma-70 family RNA polymerase sigma factor [Actinomycetota bacterium]